MCQVPKCNYNQILYTCRYYFTNLKDIVSECKYDQVPYTCRYSFTKFKDKLYLNVNVTKFFIFPGIILLTLQTNYFRM